MSATVAWTISNTSGTGHTHAVGPMGARVDVLANGQVICQASTASNSYLSLDSIAVILLD